MAIFYFKMRMNIKINDNKYEKLFGSIFFYIIIDSDFTILK